MNDSITRLCEIVALLRAPGGCPWDREQTPRSLCSSLLEECYEVIEAIEKHDDENLKEELGDLLINIIMQAQILSEREVFDFKDIAYESCEKLVRRHPHVFNKMPSSKKSTSLTTADVLNQWENIKKQEKLDRSKKTTSALHGVPEVFPALLHAEKIQKKAAKVGFDWPCVKEVLAKIHEELAEVEEALATNNQEHQEEELGDLLFSIVNLTRSMNMNAELLLQQATKKFIHRFYAMESILQEKNYSIDQCSFDQWNELWNQVKSSR